jgi:hypothetical protein
VGVDQHIARPTQPGTQVNGPGEVICLEDRKRDALCALIAAEAHMEPGRESCRSHAWPYLKDLDKISNRQNHRECGNQFQKRE